ncbi:hypothetical protein [Salegentibacter sp. F14]
MKSFVILFPILIIVSSCQTTENIQQIDREELNRQLEEIRELIAKEICDEENTCDYIAVGSKPCGGPKMYLLFPSSINRQKLEAMVNTYNKAEADYNKKYEIISDCRLVTPPERIECINGKCEAI